MRLLYPIFRFYLESSIHVSLAVVAFTMISLMEFEWATDWNLFGFVFFGSITGYNFVKYASLAGWHHRSLAKNLRWIQVFSFLSFLALGYFAFQVSERVIWGSLVLGLLTIFYGIPFFKHKNLRSLSGVKVFIVAFVWAGVTLGLPWAVHSNAWELDFVISFLQRFLWVLVLTFPFEIRDLKYDHPDLGTLPQQFGVKRTKLFGFFLLLVVILLEGCKDFQWTHSLMLVFMILCTGLLLGFAKRKQSALYASFLVESIPVVSLFVYWGFWHYLFIS